MMTILPTTNPTTPLMRSNTPLMRSLASLKSEENKFWRRAKADVKMSPIKAKMEEKPERIALKMS